ncbi:pyridoxamine 5'-phosphate oxidase family protein [Natrialbaceae archaeon A-gly3]
MDKIEYVYTFGMTDEEVRGYLEGGEVGVLSLAKNGRAYAIPVGYLFDDSSLFIRLSEEYSSKKMEFIDGTTEACFLLYDVKGSASWSIVATGGLSELEADE